VRKLAADNFVSARIPLLTWQLWKLNYSPEVCHSAQKNYQREQPERVQFGDTNAEISALLARYLQAWETDDVDGLVALLKEDATLSMPPVPSWYQGRDAIRRVLSAVLFPPGVYKQWRLSPTHANGHPAFVVYRADEPTRSYRAFAIQVLTLTGSPFPKQVASLTAFLGPELPRDTQRDISKRAEK
jgi:RNA polymerase sigma-70 factor (ECF subfamily)